MMNDGSSSSSSSPSTKMDVDVLVDESYFSALFDYNEVFPISDENYATEVHLQEALLSSLFDSKVENTNHHPHVQTNYATWMEEEETEIKVEKYDDDDDDVFPISDENYQEALLSSLLDSKVENTNHHPQVQKKYATCIKEEETEIKVENNHYDDVFPISDENYQEARLSSSLDSKVENTNHHPQVQNKYATWIKEEETEIKVENYDYDDVFPISDENYLFDSKVENNDHHPHVQEKYATWIKEKETEIKVENESTEPCRSLCMICMDEKPSSDIFRGTPNCTHSYCTDCTVRYVATKIKENVVRIKCPDVECTQLIEPYTYRDLIPEEVFERWEKVLCESLFLSWDKFYCPFKDCSAMMVDDGSNAKVTQTECPSCNRLFCAQCKVTWHAGIGCEEFQRYRNTKKKSSGDEDALLIQMAKSKHWRRCPRCKFYVEKTEGCMHISCRCGFQFCYRCGAKWDSKHYGKHLFDDIAIPVPESSTVRQFQNPELYRINHGGIAIPRDRRSESIWKRTFRFLKYMTR